MTDGDTIQPGALVVVHLINPSEKMWGVLRGLAVQGITLHGLNVASFEDWMAQAARRDEPQTLGLTTVFVPLFRVEKLFLDEPVGQVESLQQRFRRRVGVSVAQYLSLSERSFEESAEVPS